MSSAECVRSDVLAFDHRDAGQLRRWVGRKPETDSVLSVVRIIILEE